MSATTTKQERKSTGRAPLGVCCVSLDLKNDQGGADVVPGQLLIAASDTDFHQEGLLPSLVRLEDAPVTCAQCGSYFLTARSLQMHNALLHRTDFGAAGRPLAVRKGIRQKLNALEEANCRMQTLRRELDTLVEEHQFAISEDLMAYYKEGEEREKARLTYQVPFYKNTIEQKLRELAGARRQSTSLRVALGLQEDPNLKGDRR